MIFSSSLLQKLHAVDGLSGLSEWHALGISSEDFCSCHDSIDPLNERRKEKEGTSTTKKKGKEWQEWRTSMSVIKEKCKNNHHPRFFVRATIDRSRGTRA